MRIIAGDAKGTKLRSPKGLKLRPTSERVRGAIFGILGSMPRQPQRVLDLYSGTGALGIEALSRGAEWVDFVERDAGACAIIRQNLASAGFADRSHVYCSNVSKALGFLSQPYDLILADPPYLKTSPGELLTRLSRSPLLGEDTTVIFEESSQGEVAESAGDLRLVKTRRYGDTLVAIYHRKPVLESEEE